MSGYTGKQVTINGKSISAASICEAMKQTAELFAGVGGLFEVRNVTGFTKSGYFKSGAEAAEAITNYSSDSLQQTWYIVMNEPDEACYSRKQSRRILSERNLTTTSDDNIRRLKWILIDADPVRPSGVSATDAEKAAAWHTINDVRTWLSGKGFPLPVVCDSGNGYHLLYRVDAAPSESQKTERFLKALDIAFSNEQVNIDKTVFNPARITKLYGSIATKGADTPERPWRQSAILEVPQNLQILDFNQVESVTNAIIPPEATETVKKGKGTAGACQSINLREFMQHNGISYTSAKPGRDSSTIYYLNPCPFCGSQTGSRVAEFGNGAVAFFCHHDRCTGKKWQDLRQLYEPGCYDRQTYDESKQIPSGDSIPPVQPHEASNPKVQQTDWSRIVAQSAADIDFTQTPQPTPYIDGILTEGVYLLNAFSKVGKSRLMLQMLLALSTGSSFLGRDTIKCDTLYLALEDERIDYENRLCRFLDGSPAPENLYTLTRESFPNYNTPTLDNMGGLDIIIENHLKQHPGTKVVGIDVLSKIRSQSDNKDFTRDERKDLEHLLTITAKHQIAIVVAHHVSVTGMRGSAKRNSAIGSGAGSYQISGTVTGEYEIATDADKKGLATFRANGRRIRAQEICIEDNYPMWSLVGDADEVRRREKEQARESKLLPLAQTIEYLVDRDKNWKGRASFLLQENQYAEHLLPMCAAPTADEMQSRDLLVMLKRDGYAAEVVKNGSASAMYKLYRLGDGIEAEQTKITG